MIEIAYSKAKSKEIIFKLLIIDLYQSKLQNVERLINSKVIQTKINSIIMYLFCIFSNFK